LENIVEIDGVLIIVICHVSKSISMLRSFISKGKSVGEVLESTRYARPSVYVGCIKNCISACCYLPLLYLSTNTEMRLHLVILLAFDAADIIASSSPRFPIFLCG
jgi:hypothetical protein